MLKYYGLDVAHIVRRSAGEQPQFQNMVILGQVDNTGDLPA